MERGAKRSARSTAATQNLVAVEIWNLCVSVAVALSVRGGRAHRDDVRAIPGILRQEDLDTCVGDTPLMATRC